MTPASLRKSTTGTARQRGFSLIELLAVTALVAIIGALAMPAYRSVRRLSYNAMALSDLMATRTAVASDTATLPSTETVIITSGPAALSIAPQVRVSRGVRLVVEVTTSGGNGKGKGKGLDSAPGQNKGVDGFVIRAQHTLGSASYSIDETGVISTSATN